MASRKTNEQCMTWLRSMAADSDSLNGINAELCLNLIQNQKKQLDKLGAIYRNMQMNMDRMIKEKESKAVHFMLDFPDRMTAEQRNFMENNGIEIEEF